MKKILLDTNAYSSFLRGNNAVFEALVEADVVYMSVIVLGELLAGFRSGKQYVLNLERLKNFLDKDGVQVVDASLETAEIFGDLKAELAKKGGMIPINDIWIAAHTIETGAKLITFDTHFQHIVGLRVWDGL